LFRQLRNRYCRRGSATCACCRFPDEAAADNPVALSERSRRNSSARREVPVPVWNATISPDVFFTGQATLLFGRPACSRPWPETRPWRDGADRPGAP
jgi:hypothetical protein